MVKVNIFNFFFHPRRGGTCPKPRYLNYVGRTDSALTLLLISRDPTPCMAETALALNQGPLVYYLESSMPKPSQILYIIAGPASSEELAVL